MNGARHLATDIVKSEKVRRFVLTLSKFALLVFYLSSLFSVTNASAKEEGESCDCRPFTFSYVSHPCIKEVVVPLIERAYQAIGYEVRLIEMPSHREMIELSSGKIDGTVIASEVLFRRYDNIIAVEPAITRSVFTLLCSYQVSCSKDILFREKATVLMTKASEKAIRFAFPEMKSKVYNVNLLSAIPSLVNEGRFLYGIYVAEENESLQGEGLIIQNIPLIESKAYHVVHSKHAKLVPEISQQIEKNLAASED